MNTTPNEQPATTPTNQIQPPVLPQPSFPSVSHFAVRLPPFWTANPAIWFVQAECQFQLAGITTQATQFRHVVSTLPPEVAADVADVLCAPLGQTPYDTLKAAIIERTMASERRRLQQLLSGEDLGDRRPSQFLRHLQSLLGDRAATFDEALLKELLLQRLPPTVQMLLATATNLSASELALHADKIMEVAVPSIAAVASLPANLPPCPTIASPSATLAVNPQLDAIADIRADVQRLAAMIAAITPATTTGDQPHHHNRHASRAPRSPRPHRRSPSPARPNTSNFCWYHWNFGSRARNCTPPCAWPGNASGDR